MAKKLRLGILGTGIAARELYRPAFERLRDRVELAACANRRRSKALEYAHLARIPRVVGTAEELFALPDLDAILISLPIHLQPRYVLAALAAGKAVVSEKPVAPSVAAGRRLLRAAARFSPPWLVAENYAFMPAVQQLQAWVERGRLGGIRLVEAAMTAWLDRSNPFFRTAWRARPEHGGFIVDAGVHLAHVVRRCFGPPVKVSSLTGCFTPALPPIDTAVAVLERLGCAGNLDDLLHGEARGTACGSAATGQPRSYTAIARCYARRRPGEDLRVRDGQLRGQFRHFATLC
jgi:predicted dehydrogenase